MKHRHHNTKRGLSMAISRLCGVSVTVAAMALTGCSGTAPQPVEQAAAVTTTTAVSTRACSADGALVLQGTRCVDECYDGWEPNVGGVCVRAEPLATTTTARPLWCSHYDAWKRAVDEQDEIESRYGPDVTQWPDHVYKGWETMLEAQMSAADILWDGTEAGSVPKGWDARARACR